MTDHQQSAIDAGMPIMRCRTHCPNDTDCKTCESEVQKIIAAAEPHLRRKWAEEIIDELDTARATGKVYTYGDIQDLIREGAGE